MQCKRAMHFHLQNFHAMQSHYRKPLPSLTLHHPHTEQLLQGSNFPGQWSAIHICRSAQVLTDSKENDRWEQKPRFILILTQ